MPITATCPHCSETFTVPDSAGGKRFKCRACKQPMDVPKAGEEAPAAVPAAAPAEADESEDEDDEDESEDEGADEDVADEESGDEESDEDDEDESEDEDEEDEDPKAKRRRERLEKKKGKDKGKDKKKDRKKDRKKKDKKEKKSFSAPKIEMGDAPDANETMGVVLGSIQRALHPSRVLTAVVGMAAVLIIGAVLATLINLMGQNIGAMALLGLVAIGVEVGFVVVAVAIAKVDLAALRGEEVPGPKEALLSSIGGGIGAVISALLLGLLVAAVVVAMVIVALLGLIPYLGSILGLPLVVVFFFVFLAILLGVPLVMWLMIPLASESGANPIAPLKGAIARVKAEPARILITYIMFIVLSELILGVLTVFGAAAAIGAGGLWQSVKLFVWPGVLALPGAGLVEGIFFGAGMAIVAALILSPFMAAFICAGCQEIHDHPRDDEE